MPRNAEQLTSRTLFRLLLVGIVAWEAIAIGWSLWGYVITKANPQSNPYEVDWALYGLYLSLFSPMGGYVPGGLVMLAYGATQVWRGGVRFKELRWAALVYFLPVVPVIFLQLVPVALPLELTRNDEYFDGLWWGPWKWVMSVASYSFAAPNGPPVRLFIGLGTLPFVLYLIGLGIGFARRNRPLRQTGWRMLAPPLFGTSLVALMMLGAMLDTPYWKFRDAFAFSVERIEWKPGGLAEGLTADATVHLKRGGAYYFQALYQEQWPGGEEGEERTVKSNAVQWLDTGEKPQNTGSYRIRLEWERSLRVLIPTRPATRHVVFQIYSDSDPSQRRCLKIFLLPVPNPPVAQYTS